MTIKNTNPGSTADRIVIGSESLQQGDTVSLTLAGVNIDRSSITTTEPAALTITDTAAFNVSIFLKDGTENTLKGAGGYRTWDTDTTGSPGIQKNGDTGVGMLTITGSAGENAGKLTATGGVNVAGIGGGRYGSTSNITISGGKITANAGVFGAGIGGGYYGTGSDITISGGTVTTTGGTNGAGIGGGASGNGSSITISGGTVTATGGARGAGIGGGYYGGTGSNITISGGSITATGGGDAVGIGSGSNSPESTGNSITSDNAVVIAESGDASKTALEGFAITDKGLIFTKQGSSGSWSVDMYSSSVDVTADVTIPANLEVGAGKVLTVDNGATFAVSDGITLATSDDGQFTVASGGTLQNDGTIADDANISGTGNITTRTHFYLADGTLYGTDDYYQIYKTGGNVQKYTNLPNPDVSTLAKSNVDTRASLTDKAFAYWYYLNTSGAKVPINDTTDVLLNQHTFYEETVTVYNIIISSLQNGSITSSKAQAAKDETVTLTATPDKGYELSSGSLKVVAGSTEVALTDKGDGTYTFSMPEANVVVSAAFEPAPEPTPGTEDGWVQSDAGWQYVLNGEYLNDGWHYIIDQYGEHWYFFDADTYMATSRWIWDDAWEGWYWVCSTGPMIENLWQWIDNAWYGFWWGGKMCQGWVWDTYYNAWYFCNEYNGRVACNEWAWDGAWYYFDQNCHMVTNAWVGDCWLNEHGMWV